MIARLPLHKQSKEWTLGIFFNIRKVCSFPLKVSPLLLVCFFKIDKPDFFREVFDSQQTWAESTENFHTTPPSNVHNLSLYWHPTPHKPECFLKPLNTRKRTVYNTCNTTELWVLLVKMRVAPALEDCKWDERPISLLPRDNFMCWSSSSTRDLRICLNQKERQIKSCHIIHSNDIISRNNLVLIICLWNILNFVSIYFKRLTAL